MDEQKLRLSQVSSLTGIKRHTLNARVKNIFSEPLLTRSPSNQILLTPPQIKQSIEDKLCKFNGKIIYIGNLKGGVGKTTISYLLTNAASTLGLKTCVIDLDVQANLTHQYMRVDAEQPVFFDIIDNSKKIKDIIVNISETLAIIPSSLKNSLIQKTLAVQAPKHHQIWFKTLCLDYLRENYDLIIVDTPPHLTTLNSVFCLCLGEEDHIAIPVCAEDFSIMGVQMFLDDIMEIRKSYNVSNSPKISIIMNRFFQNQKTNLEMLVKMGQIYEGMLSDVVIRDNAKTREVVNDKTPLADLKHGKEIYELIKNLMQEFDILKKTEE